MSAREQSSLLMYRLIGRGIKADFAAAETFRRAQLTLHRWAELECGDGNGHIERDEKTGIPRYHNDRHSFLAYDDPRAWSRIADREAGALRRVKAECDRIGCHYFHQTDPRGCALYVCAEPMTDSDYTKGVATC